MDFFDEINKLNSIFLVNIEEPEENRLLIIIKAATVSDHEEDIIIGDKNLGPARRISMDGPGQEYEVYFRTYAAYSITNESFATFEEQAERLGRIFCVYSKSVYLDYIRNNTIVEYIREGELKHYRIICQTHVIDIASMEIPTIGKR